MNKLLILIGLLLLLSSWDNNPRKDMVTNTFQHQWNEHELIREWIEQHKMRYHVNQSITSCYSGYGSSYSPNGRCTTTVILESY